MSKQLIHREGPEFQFILPDYQSNFERSVIDSYIEFEYIEQSAPIVEYDLFEDVLSREDEAFIASMHNIKYRDDQFFKLATSDMFEHDKQQFINEEMYKYNSFRQYEYDDELLADILSVMNFHRLFYMVKFAQSEYLRGSIERGTFYKNIPLTEVW